jgi:hypothetical protein
MAPPRTPPFLLFALYISYMSSAFVNLCQHWINESPLDLPRLAILIAQLLVFTGLVWLAGSLPLLTDLPGPNVSELDEVSRIISS